MDATLAQSLVNALQALEGIGLAVAVLLAILVCAMLLSAWAIVRALQGQQPYAEPPPGDLADLQNRVEDALEKGDFRRAMELVDPVLEDYPMHLHANWYKAIAEFRGGAIHDATRSFKRVLELAPDWTYSVEPYLELLAEQARSARPRPVQGGPGRDGPVKEGDDT
jgi:tetratricopeptide (TPR) repeat protein